MLNSEANVSAVDNNTERAKIAVQPAPKSGDMVALEERLAVRQRPAGRAIGYHRWSDLTFLHWRFPVELIAPLLPEGLTLDTWEGDAWVGLVPFSMSGVRPWWSPAIPGVSNFAETNVRTYVHHRSKGPGVWFFSLDAASSLAVTVARRRWNLNYFRSRMSVVRQGNRLTYSSKRLWPKPAGAHSQIEIELAEGNADSQPTVATHAAQPGTLEFFLVERYVMYMQRADGRLRGGRVWHEPYPVQEPRLLKCEESLLASLGIRTDTTPCHVAYSPGVQVEIFAPYDLDE